MSALIVDLHRMAKFTNKAIPALAVIFFLAGCVIVIFMCRKDHSFLRNMFDR